MKSDIYIHPTAQVHPSVSIGEGCYIGPYCVIGYPPENIKTWEESLEHSVIIGKNTAITGMSSIDAGTIRHTIIGDDCFLMKHMHIGHDSIIGNSVTISPGAKVGGHCEIGDFCNLGMNSTIHQRVKIPKGCMLGMSAVVPLNVSTTLVEGYVYVGNPIHMLKPNPKYKCE